MSEDSQLLDQFAAGSQAAFAELVRRKIDLVYAAAVRQTGGDAHLAQDVTQGVFMALAARARELRRHAALTGWLYTTTRFVAAKAVRTQARWQRREQEASTMNPTIAENPEAWQELRPMIDAALHELGEPDRVAILLRYFEAQPLASVGAALGLTENAARMRVERALEKLRVRLAGRGITSTAAALGAALANQPLVSAPVALAASVTRASLAGAAVGGLSALAGSGSTLAFMSATKLAAGAAALVLAGALGGYLGAQAWTRSGATSRVAGVSNAAPATIGRGADRRPAGGEAVTKAMANAGRPAAPGAASARVPASDPLDPLRVLVDLQRRQLMAPDVKLFATGAQLTPQFVELFALRPDEQLALRRGIEGARARLAELTRENTVVDRPQAGAVTIAMKAFPEAGGAAYDALLKTFADTLGAERYGAFMALGAEQMEKSLGRFGAAQRSIMITREPDPEGPLTYRMHDVRRADRDNSNYVSDFMSAERLQEEMGALFDLLPADFAPRK